MLGIKHISMGHLHLLQYDALHGCYYKKFIFTVAVVGCFVGFLNFPEKTFWEASVCVYMCVCVCVSACLPPGYEKLFM